MYRVAYIHVTDNAISADNDDDVNADVHVMHGFKMYTL